MMLRWIWLVPPAILPPGAASMPDAPGPSTVLAAPPRPPRSIAASNINSVIPSFINDAAVDAAAPWRRPIAL